MVVWRRIFSVVDPGAFCGSRSGRGWRQRSTVRARFSPARRSRWWGGPQGPRRRVAESRLLPLRTPSQRSRAVRGAPHLARDPCICRSRRAHQERFDDRHDDEPRAEVLRPCASPRQRHLGMVRKINRTYDRGNSGHDYILTRVVVSFCSPRIQSTELATRRAGFGPAPWAIHQKPSIRFESLRFHCESPRRWPAAGGTRIAAYFP